MSSLVSNRLGIVSFGEVFVLWLIGSATLGLALVGRPGNLEANLLAVVLSATISFLCVLVIEPVNKMRASLVFDLIEDDASTDIRSEPEEKDRDFIVLSLTSAFFALVLFALFALAIYQKV